MVIGETIGPFTVIAKLGEGGMGQVWRARDTTLNRDVALKVRPDGTVKVLDFGLAKALDTNPASASDDDSPTITSPGLTMRGVILGTAAYMAPEQAKGKPVDRRADVWAFGAVLYEMLTGQRAFWGEDSTDLIAAVVSKEPDWSALPASTPASIRTLLRRCLEKDRKRRLDSASAVGLELEDARIMPATFEPSTPAPRRAVLVALAFVIGGALAAAIAAWVLTRPAPPTPAPLVRFAVTLPPALRLELSRQASVRDFAVAPDGSFLVYRAADRGQLVVRWFDRLEAEPLAGISTAAMPFVSPDSRWIGFVQDDLTLKKVAATGGTPVTLAPLFRPMAPASPSASATRRTISGRGIWRGRRWRA